MSFNASAFDVAWILKNKLQDEVIDNGRGQVYLFSLNATALVHRHYLRGGMISKLSYDWYLWRGAESSRAFREWRILSDLFQEGFPVPQPWGARLVRSAAVYTQDLITYKIPNVLTLANHLCESSLDLSQWKSIARMVRRFHDRGVYHADLNANNILLDDQYNFFLIDFDRAELRDPGEWQQSNLQRLKRSLDKLSGLHQTFYFSDENWKVFTEAYAA